MAEELKDKIIEFVKSNPRVSSVDTVGHFTISRFNFRLGAVIDAISELEKEKRLDKVWVGYTYELRVL